MAEGDGAGRLGEAIAARREKLERLRARGIDPFAVRFDLDAPISQFRERYGDIEAGTEVADGRARVAGRIVLFRHHGNLSFATIRDRSDEIQLFLSRDRMGEAYAMLDDLDLFDIVGAEGQVMKTRKGELSIAVERLTLLTKALRPPPDKWHGVRDAEARARRPYLDLATRPESREALRARALVLKALRRVLDQRGFLEVETPVLHPSAGGALARPFVTHHVALDVDLYLRIALELYLKRMLVGGLERVYEIGRNFRNEGVDRQHNPEFTMLEFYWAYADVNRMMDLCEEILRANVVKVLGTSELRYGDYEIDFSQPFERLTMKEAIRKYGSPGTADSNLDSLGGARLAELFEATVEHVLVQPTFITDFPKPLSPLSKGSPDDPSVAERFELFMAGMECANGFSELNDPKEQYERFTDQMRQRERGDEEAMVMDEDYIRALSYGMPPAAGIGIGIDRFVMLLTNQLSIRDVILFPHMRPERKIEEL